MSNFDRAVKVLDAQGAYCGQCSREPGDSLDVCRDCAAVLETYAHALEEAGLIAPDLPAYTEAGADAAWWYAATYGIGVGRLSRTSPLRIMLWDSEPGGVLYTEIESAREYALKILAACEHAEKEQGNE